MSKYEFSNINPLKIRKRKGEEESDNEIDDDFVEREFSNKRTRSRNKRIKLLASYNSDSSDGYDSESDGSTRHAADSKEVLDTLNEEDKSEEDMFAFSDDERDAIPEEKTSKNNSKEKLNIELFPKENSPSSDREFNDHFNASCNDGIQIEAFNVEEEAKNGIFDQHGNYIEAEEDANDAMQEQDMWIEDFKDVEKAAEAQRKMNQINNKVSHLTQKCRKHYMLEEALSKLQYFLSKNDTVLSALANFNKLRKRCFNEHANDPKGLKAENYISNAINYVSELVDVLQTKGVENVYDLTRGQVTKLILEESITDTALEDDYKTKLWYFKWLGSNDSIHGNYTNYQMQYWKQTYFKNSAIVKFHDEPDQDLNWFHIDCITFM